MKTRSLFATVAAAVTLAVVAACSPGATSSTAGSATGTTPSSTTDATASAPAATTLKIGASSVPHAVILEYVKANLAQAAGLDLQITIFDDYVLPNVALSEGDLDANYFQHEPYLKAQVKDKKYDFTSLAAVHIEPFGIYSTKHKSLNDLQNGATVGITDDPSNQSRALKLLADQGLITLADRDNDGAFTLYEIGENSRNLKFVETAPQQLARALADVDIAILNGNFALQAGLNPAKEALVLESGVNNPYANLLVVRTKDANRPELKKLAELLTSPQVKEFITSKWADGAVLPAF